MLQRTPISGISTPAEVLDAWHSPVPDGWIETARRALRLPTSWQGYLFFSLVLGLIACAVGLQVILSVQIMQANVALGELEADLLRIERRNAELIWRIGQHTALDDVRRRAQRQGYVPLEQTRYVVRRPAPASSAQAIPDGSDPPAAQFYDLEIPVELIQMPESSRVYSIPVQIENGWRRITGTLTGWRNNLPDAVFGRFGDSAGSRSRILPATHSR